MSDQSRMDGETEGLQAQLDEAVAQIETLQSATAEAEARAASAQTELSTTRAELIEARQAAQARMGEISEMEDLREQAGFLRSQLASTEAQLSEARSGLHEVVLKYREALLSASPHIPPDLVPGETVQDVERQMEAAERVAGQIRESLRRGGPASRIPLGAPSRRAVDLSALSSSEKIRLGLQDRERK